MSIFLSVIALGVAGIGYLVYSKLRKSVAELKRESFIREYVFPQGLLARLAERRPQLTLKEQQLVLRGLRKFFCAT